MRAQLGVLKEGGRGRECGECDGVGGTSEE
jgi:hypothetical protein